MLWLFKELSSSLYSSWSGRLRIVGSFGEARRVGLGLLLVLGAGVLAGIPDLDPRGTVSGYFFVQTVYYLGILPFSDGSVQSSDEVMLTTTVYAIALQLNSTLFYRYITLPLFAVVLVLTRK